MNKTNTPDTYNAFAYALSNGSVWRYTYADGFLEEGKFCKVGRLWRLGDDGAMHTRRQWQDRIKTGHLTLIYGGSQS